MALDGKKYQVYFNVHNFGETIFFESEALLLPPFITLQKFYFYSNFCI